MLCLGQQQYTCFLCDVLVFPSTALFRCSIPATDRYWARVYGEAGAESAFRRAMRWRAFCEECAPDGSVRRSKGPTAEEMRHRGPGAVDASVTDWLIRAALSYRKNYKLKQMAAYRAYLLDGQPYVPYNTFAAEMQRLYAVGQSKTAFKRVATETFE